MGDIPLKMRNIMIIDWDAVFQQWRFWNYYASHSDQGLLYYYTKYYLQSISIIIGDAIQNWIPNWIPNATNFIQDNNINKIILPIKINPDHMGVTVTEPSVPYGFCSWCLDIHAAEEKCKNKCEITGGYKGLQVPGAWIPRNFGAS